MEAQPAPSNHPRQWAPLLTASAQTYPWKCQLGAREKRSWLLDPFLLPAHIQTCSFGSPACLTKPTVLLPFLSLHSQPSVPVSSLTAPLSHPTPTPQLISPEACSQSPALGWASLHCLFRFPRGSFIPLS